MRVDGQEQRVRTLGAERTLVDRAARVALDVDELGGLGVDELAATDGAIGTETVRDSGAAQREAFSAVRGLIGWVSGRDGCERATKGSLNMSITSTKGRRIGEGLGVVRLLHELPVNACRDFSRSTQGVGRIDSAEVGVDVEARIANEAEQRDPALASQVDRQT